MAASPPSAHCGVFPPPPGVTPNCVHPTTQTANNIALHTVMIFLATCSLSVRLYTRFYITRSAGLDDYLCIIGFGLLVSYSAMLLVCGKYFLGHHIWDIPKSDYIYGHKLEVISEWLYIFISPTLKLAVLWLYHRIFGPQTRIHNIINAGIIFNIVAYTALFFISLLSCMPVERRLNPYVPGNCLPNGVSAYLSGAINVFTDAFVVFLPIPVIGKLTMAFIQKVRAMAIFGVGIIVLALSITRLAKTPLVFKETDPTWSLSNFAIYSILELYFGLMCACFLASPKFLDRYGPSVIRRIRSYTSSLRNTSSNKSEDNGPYHMSYGQNGSQSDAGKEAAFAGGLAPHDEGKSERQPSITMESKDSSSSMRPFNAV